MSLLAGRIFFKNVRYHGQNETILIHDGYITWRYWLRHVQELEFQGAKESGHTTPKSDKASDRHNTVADIQGAEASKEKKIKHLPCRVLLKSRGVEWFIYNRSPAYDAIFRTMKDGGLSQHKAETPTPWESGYEVGNDKDTNKGEGSSQEVGEKWNDSDGDKSSSLSTDYSLTESQPASISSSEILNLLPIGIECSKGAVVMGNRNTRSILTAKFVSAAGRISARETRTVDQYKQTFDFDFVHPVIEFKRNKEYTEPQLSEGATLHSTSSYDHAKRTPGWFERSLYPNSLRRGLSSLRDFIPYRKGSVESLDHPHAKSAGTQDLGDINTGAYGQSRWLGLTRYLDDDDDDDLVEQERWKAVEYGQFSTIVDSPNISMSIHWDVPGFVHGPTKAGRKILPKIAMDINGDAPPDWGIDLNIGGGTIHYGPWADRQRTDLQRVFFPTLYKDVTSTARLAPGQRRVSTILKIVIEIEDQTTLRVPTREESKDWKWKGHNVSSAAKGANNKKRKHHEKVGKTKKPAQSSGVRPAGWLDVKVLPDSTISLSMDLVPKDNGYQNLVNMDLKGLEISSSVNHGLLWRSKSQTISCDLSNPLAWNSLRQWHIDIHDNSMELFILRDHMFLLSDLISDWASGPIGTFHTFVPFEYTIRMHMSDFKLYLNANDSNVINNPSDIEDNTFVIVLGKHLRADFVIPARTYRPTRSRLTFEVKAFDNEIHLHSPPRNTQHTFLKDLNVASLKDLLVKGSYNYSTTTSPNLTDILLLDLRGLSPRIHLYGFLVRCFMKIKDNYFGDAIHFHTLEEYQDQIDKNTGEALENPVSAQHNRISNDLDVVLGIVAENLCMILPGHLYSSDENIRFEVLSVTSDLRITNYYMDLAVSFSPIATSYGSCSGKHLHDHESYSNTQLYIDGAQISGHRLFGLPPTEPTYVCNWDFDVGTVTGECSIEFVKCIIMSFRCFGFTFDDAENALPSLYPNIVHDVTFLRARLQPVLIGLRMEHLGFILGTGRVELDFNDWAGTFFSDRLRVMLPELTLTIVNAEGAPLHRGTLQSPASTLGYLQATVEIFGANRKHDFKMDLHLQQSHMAFHDRRTHRVPWLIHDHIQHEMSEAASRSSKTIPPAMPSPSMPEPIITPGSSTIDGSSLVSTSAESGSSLSASTRKSSFLIGVTSAILKRRKATTCDSGRGVHPHQRPDKRPNVSASTEYGTTPKVSTHKLTIDQMTDSLLVNERSAEFAISPADPPRSDLSFSSPYKTPYFPLLVTKPDTSDLPIPPDHLSSDPFSSDSNALKSLKAPVPDQNAEQSSLMINFSQGIQVYCTPKALFSVTEVLAIFQTKDSVTLLDDLQIHVMTDISNSEETRSKEKKITDIRVFVPWLGARFVNKTETGSTSTTRQDRYEMTIDHLTLTARLHNRSFDSSTPHRPSHYSIHLAFNQADFSARESMKDRANDEAVIGLSISDPVFWMVHGSTTAARLQFENFEVVSASRKIDYVSSLIHQTLTLFEDLAARFASLIAAQQSRIRLLVLLLTTDGNNIPDPPFLTRASYALRSASHHIRISDSWRMMSRLRYIYQCLPERSRDKIHTRCMNSLLSCPKDAGQRVISTFERWQNWDCEQVKSSLLMQKVYGDLLEPLVQGPNALVPLKATVNAGMIRVLAEPGPLQNEFTVKGLVLGLAVNQTMSSHLQRSHHSFDATWSSIQVHCVEAVIRLNWTLLEVLENIIRAVQNTIHSRQHDTSVPSGSRKPLDHRRLHLVVSSEMSILKCDTPNLNIISLCQGLKTSIALSEDSSGLQGISMSVVLKADTATAEIKAHSTMLTLYKLRKPMIFASKQECANKDILESWKLIGIGQDVRFQVFANPVRLVEAADRFLEQEVAHIIDWTKSLWHASTPAQMQPNGPEKTGLPRLLVGLSLGTYIIDLAILPSLSYQISGTTARCSIKMHQRGKSDWAIDFDLNEHSHTFMAKRSDGEFFNVLSSLQMPPISGRLSLDVTSSRKTIVFNGLVENIVFDASALHSIFTAVNRPEIISLGTSVRNEVSVLQGHYRSIFGAIETGRKSQSSSREPMLYVGDVNLASLSIRARTSDTLSNVRGAELQFKMNHLQLKATNKETSLGTVMTFPELEVQFKGMDLNLLRLEQQDLVPCGSVAIKAKLQSTSKANDDGRSVRSHQIQSSILQINVNGETGPVIVAVLVHLQNTLKTVDLSQEVQSLKKIGRARLRSEARYDQINGTQVQGAVTAPALFNAMYSLEMANIGVIWNNERSTPTSTGQEPENLILSITKIDLTTKKDNTARLLIENLQLQMVPASEVSTVRSSDSALLPEVLFNVAYVSTGQDRRLAFQVAGKSLDLRLTSQFILPASDLRRSMAHSIQQVRTATADWNASSSATNGQTKRLLGDKNLASLLIDADFAGAVVYVQSRSVVDPHSSAINVPRGGRFPQHGRYNQFTPENASNSSTTLRAPGIALKVEYKNAGPERQSLNAEMHVDASSNTLYPTVVPLVLEITSAIKDIVGEPNEREKLNKSSLPQPKFLEDDPAAIFGNCRLNLGLRISRQEFSLSCQPIARVAATARFDDIYITVNTVQTQEHGKFFAVSGAFARLQASVRHVYSRESTGSFEVDSLVVSLMNSRHVSTTNGVSAILNISPMKAQVNGKQSQDFLLFREIWMPPEVRQSAPEGAPISASESQAIIVQRYQQVAATSAFPWNATVSIAKLDVQVDLGQALGKSAFVISKFWITSKKTSDWEQNLCLGFEKLAVDSTGRMSGFVEIQNLKVRTSIQWPMTEQAHERTPLVQAALSFDHLRVKAAFDYQAFAIADIVTFEFLMYNVRDLHNGGRDRLVGVLDGNKVQVFCTTTSASQIVALYQAFQRLYQEKLAAYQASLRDTQKFLRRKSSINTSIMRAVTKRQEDTKSDTVRSSLKLQTDVVVSLQAVNIGTFPTTLFDNQVFKLEALDASARFAVVLEDEKIHSTLGMTLGQLRIALSGIIRTSVPKTLGEVSVTDVVASATGSRGGTILKVPKLVATMETWQSPEKANIDYIFKSSFQGKVDVGWNYSRISYIRGMWTSHARALAQRLGRPLPQSAVQITGGPLPEGDEGSQTYTKGEQNKITTVVNVPQSKYQYTALQPPIIETPQLRDMGEATPPLEWIGLHRERLPNLTHQIIIVSLLEVAKEVDDAYSKILGSSMGP